jgi:Kef-type K+ transport system membrane component KefB
MSPVNLTPEAFTGIELVAIVAFLAPLLLDLLRLRFLPSVVLEIGAGMLIGSYGLGWVRSDDLPIQVFALIGLSFLLFLAGMEVQLIALRGPRLHLGLVGFAISFALAQVLLRPLAAHTVGDTSTPTSRPFGGLPRLGALALRPWHGGATPDPSP